MQNINIRLAIGALVLGLLGSCGDAPKLKQQSIAGLKLPAFVGFNGGFDLQGQVSTRNYDGPLIIWRADAPPEKMAEVLAMSKRLKVFDARFKPLKLQYDSLLNSIEEAKKKVDSGELSLGRGIEER